MRQDPCLRRSVGPEATASRQWWRSTSQGTRFPALRWPEVIPQALCSVSADSPHQGFTSAGIDWTIASVRHTRERLAMLVAGLAAECLVFGPDRATNGSAADMFQATRAVASMLKGQELGPHSAAYQSDACATNLCLHDHDDALDREAETILGEARSRADAALRADQRLLLALAARLSGHSRMTSAETLQTFGQTHA